MQAYFSSREETHRSTRNVRQCAGCTPPELEVKVVLTDVRGNSFIGKRVQHSAFGEMYQHQNTLLAPSEIESWISLR